MPIFDPAHLVRRRHCFRHEPKAHQKAFEAAQLLLIAYNRDRRSGGWLDWQTLDRAYDAASEAIMLDRAERP